VRKNLPHQKHEAGIKQYQKNQNVSSGFEKKIEKKVKKNQAEKGEFEGENQANFNQVYRFQYWAVRQNERYTRIAVLTAFPLQTFYVILQR
jgi:hypothetical protein